MGESPHAYTGLAAKAVDAGIKLIIVLAGMQSSRRSQKHVRLDEGLLGFDSQYHPQYDLGPLHHRGSLLTTRN